MDNIQGKIVQTLEKATLMVDIGGIVREVDGCRLKFPKIGTTIASIPPALLTIQQWYFFPMVWTTWDSEGDNTG